MQISDGIRHVGDGWLEVTEERLQGLIVHDDINEIYDVEQTPFARVRLCGLMAKKKLIGVQEKLFHILQQQLSEFQSLTESPRWKSINRVA
ncbi:hypothetical protein DMENIID0001_060790 [Sergentomyia squamirostris]